MIGFREKAFGIVALVGLGITVHRGHEYWQVDHLVKNGKPIAGTLEYCIPYQEKATTRGNQRLKLLVRYHGCKGQTDVKFVVFRKYGLPEKGTIQLMSNDKCPETVILRDVPNDAWQEGLVGVIMLLAGGLGFFSGFFRGSNK